MMSRASTNNICMGTNYFAGGRYYSLEGLIITWGEGNYLLPVLSGLLDWCLDILINKFIPHTDDGVARLEII